MLPRFGEPSEEKPAEPGEIDGRTSREPGFDANEDPPRAPMELADGVEDPRGDGIARFRPPIDPPAENDGLRGAIAAIERDGVAILGDAEKLRPGLAVPKLLIPPPPMDGPEPRPRLILRASAENA